MLIGNKSFWFSLLLLFISSSYVFGQNECIPKADGAYLKSYWNAGISTLTQPARYTTTDWIAFAGITGTAVLLYSEDQRGFDFFDRQLSDVSKKSFTLYSDIGGSGLLSLPILGGMYWAGAARSDCLLKEASLAGLQAFVLSAGAAWLVKSLTGRPRPNEGFVAHDWHGPFSGYDAFPSGHTTRAFAVATVLSGYYKHKPWVGITAFGLAAFTASGRLLSGEHWPSDVFVGMALGYFVGRGVLKFNQKLKRSNQKKSSRSDLTFLPIIGLEQVGIMIQL